MVKWIQVARAIGGLLSVSALLYMMVMQFLREDLMLGEVEVSVLLLLIGALLGLDMIVEQALGEISVDIKKDEKDKDDGN